MRAAAVSSACKLTSHSARVAHFRVPLGVRLSLISLLKLAKPLRLSHTRARGLRATPIA
jgi:hypothetical protein